MGVGGRPVVALGFAIAVQRVAAYDMGFDSACDEIDLLEVQGDYPRGHLSRFASLYTTGRGNYTISYPNNNTALALPLNNGRSIRGEDVTTSTWQSAPVPGLMGLSVQPRSMSMFRAEEMATLAGADSYRGAMARAAGWSTGAAGAPRRDPHRHSPATGQRKEQLPGDHRRRGLRGVSARRPHAAAGAGRFGAGPRSEPDPPALRTTWERRDENVGEIRLVAWVPTRCRPGDRSAGGPPARVHGRDRPPPLRASAESRRPSLQHPGHGSREGRRDRDPCWRRRPCLRPAHAAPRRPRTARRTPGTGRHRPMTGRSRIDRDRRNRDEIDLADWRRTSHDRGDPLHQALR